MPNDSEKRLPEWLVWLIAASLVLMLTQVRLPALGGRLFLSDLGFLIGFVPLMGYCLLKRRTLPVLWPPAVLALLVAGLAAIGAAPGLHGAVEVAQFIQMVFCGLILTGALLRNAPDLALGALGYAFAFHLIFACAQWKAFGFGTTLAPADLLELKYGFGDGSYGGLFRSRMAFSLFLGGMLAWGMPTLWGNGKVKWRCAVAVALTVAGLVFLPHGEILLLTVPVLLTGMCLRSWTAGAWTLLAVLLAALLIFGPMRASHVSVLRETASPLKVGDYAGELRTNHLEFFAALSMAARVPWHGVGPGRYQECIGRCYGDLPNPSYNDIETDTQSGWGILCGTLGFPATLALALAMLAALVWGLKAHFAGEHPFALGGSMALAVLLPAMFVTDPFTRGLGWLPALAMASVGLPSPQANSYRARVPWWLVVAVGCVLGVPLLATALRQRQDDPLPAVGSHVRQEAQQGALPQESDLFLVIDASEATRFTPPFEKGKDSQAAKNEILKIPDEKGKPPEGKEPAMEYGGAEFTFEVKAETRAKIWLRVWWDGSCGNTLNVRLDDAEHSETVGNDGAYRVWHWMESPKTYTLSAGQHRLQLLNREDGIMFDQLLITNDTQYVPSGVEE
ncbi:MAG: hypothetical protein IJJ33_00485 [Victivallales bacterium]|nr:hypothetical protein [Victivallales bacterium]